MNPLVLLLCLASLPLELLCMLLCIGGSLYSWIGVLTQPNDLLLSSTCLIIGNSAILIGFQTIGLGFRGQLL